MVHDRISVSGISTWGLPLVDEVALYQRLGVQTVGAALRKLGGDIGNGVGLLGASGLAFADVIGTGPLRLDAPPQWPEQQAKLRWALEVAEQLGAPLAVTTTGPAGALDWEEAASALATALGPVLEAAPDGVRLVLEHTNGLRTDVSFLHTLRDTLEVAERLDVGVCVELTACFAEREIAATLARGVASGRIALVQVADLAEGTTSTPHRLVPGDGDIPLPRLIGALLDAGYDGCFELELIGPAIEAEGYESAIARGCDHLARLLA